MTERTREVLKDPEVRRAFEEEYLVGEATDTIAGLLNSLGLSQKVLANRLSVSPGRVSQVLSGAENLTLRSLASLGWALGVRFELAPMAMSDREGTPAADDPPPPDWLNRLRPQGSWTFRPLDVPTKPDLFPARVSARVVRGELRAA
jgi:transcriptional regulator with XRE-family HTH domain